jgi:ATP-binding cassette subfamily B protein
VSARLARAAWPIERLGEALEALARSGGLDSHPAELPRPPRNVDKPGGPSAADWIEEAVEWLRLECEPVMALYGELDDFLARAAPALVRVDLEEGPRFLLLIGAKGRRVTLVGPDHRRHKASREELRAALVRELESKRAAGVESVLDDAGVRGRRRVRARDAILREQLGPWPIGGLWLLRLPAGSPFMSQVKAAKLRRTAVAGLVAHLIQQMLLISSWWVLGRAVLQGRLDQDLAILWALLLISTTPFRVAEHWALARLTTGAGALLKRRLLEGALRLEPEEIRTQGVGQFLGRVIDSEAVESLVLTGGHVGLIAGVELFLAVPILVAGAAGWMHALVLVAWTGLAARLWWSYLAARRRWTQSRLGITHELVEKMVGHRTRLAQERPEDWHEDEDQAVEGYYGLSRDLDRTAVRLKSLVPRGWLLIGVACLVPSFLGGQVATGPLAVAIGGVLFAYKAFWKLVRGLADLGEALIAWGNVSPLYHAAARSKMRVPPGLAGRAETTGEAREGRLIEARELSFSYPGRPDPVLKGCDLSISVGDRLLLQGPSGSGKSTLAALLVGLRKPDAGLLLLGGLDRQSLGDRGWRRRTAAAPQFHENHVFTETLAFNLLMGRDWPPPPEDLVEAERVCRQLGLGELLDRMPAGLLQMVGESGWQLSHGEKSRLYIARALLQKSELVLFDESFAALDPETLNRSLRCVLDNAPTLLVVAHP